MLGLCTRLFAAFGALQILKLWLGLYNVSGEWAWTYFFLLVLQCMFVVLWCGRSLGVDALRSVLAICLWQSGIRSPLFVSLPNLAANRRGSPVRDRAS